MIDFEKIEDDINASNVDEPMDDLDEDVTVCRKQLDTRRKIENMLEERALKKLLDDEFDYDF